MSKAMKDIQDYINKEKSTGYDELLVEVGENIIRNKAVLETTRKYIKEVEAIGMPVPGAVTDEEAAYEEKLENAKEEIKEKFETLLDELPKEDLLKVIKKTKFATRKEISGATFLVKNARETQGRINEEIAEELIKLSPEKVLDQLDESDEKDPKVSRFVEMYKVRDISSGVAAWIDKHITNEMFNLRCKEHFEEMKEGIVTESMVPNIVDRWLGMSSIKVTEENKEEVKEIFEELVALFKKELTIF